MHLTYDLAIADLVAANLHSYKTASVWQAQRRNARIVATGLTLVLCFSATLLVARGTISLLNIILTVLAGLVLFLVYPQLSERALTTRLTRFFQSESGSGLPGTYTVTLTEDGITQASTTSTNTYPWSQVERLHITAHYLFLYAGKSNCITFPKAALDPDTSATLLETIAAHHIPIQHNASE